MRKGIKSSILAFLVLFGMTAGTGPFSRPVTTEAASTGKSAGESTESPAAADESGMDPERTVHIGVLVWKYKDPYGKSVREAMEKYALVIGEESGIVIDLDMQDADGDIPVQEEQAERMFSENKDLVIINLADTADGQFIEELAAASQTPVLFYNREPQDAGIIRDLGAVYVGTNAQEAGIQQAEIFDSLYRSDASAVDRNGDGKISYLMFEGECDNPEAVARTEYCIRTLMERKYDLEALAETQVADWDREEAEKKMDTLLKDLDPDSIEAVFCNNDAMAIGVVDVLEKAGYNLPEGAEAGGHICVLGVDATEEGLAYIRSGQIDGTVRQDADGMGKAIMTMAVQKILTGDYLEGTGYGLSDDLYSVRMPYTPVTRSALLQ